jgi:hypothetical protein
MEIRPVGDDKMSHWQDSSHMEPHSNKIRQRNRNLDSFDTENVEWYGSVWGFHIQFCSDTAVLDLFSNCFATPILAQRYHQKNVSGRLCKYWTWQVLRVHWYPKFDPYTHVANPITEPQFG